MPPNSRLRMHPAAYAAACTPPHSRRSHAAALVPSLSRRSVGAAALMLPPRTPPHFSVAASHARRSIHARRRRRRICRSIPAALAGALCRWKRTTRSAFFNAEHDAGGREPALADAGRGGAGRGPAGGLFLKRGVWGGVFWGCTYISPKGVCDGRVKNRG